MKTNNDSITNSIGSDENGSIKERGLLIPLLVISTAQLMLVLDDSISNIALPSLQKELAISAANLPWVINSYILAFGALLLFGGRAGDLFGRRKVFQIGIGIFTIASLLSGLAMNGEFLIMARAIQGIGAALSAPNALALIATTFPAGKPRATAFAVYGAMSGLGIIVGLLLGGFLTGTLGWRWVFFITVPIGLAVLMGTKHLIEAERHSGQLDVAGAVTGTAGMAALVYAITHSGEHGWSNNITVSMLSAAVILLFVFLKLQSRGKDPLLPLGLFKDRNRSGSYLGMMLVSFAPMGALFITTLYMQLVLNYLPLKTGLALLPFSFGIILSAGITSKLVAKIRPRILIGTGMLIAAASSWLLSNLGLDANYFVHIMPALFATAFGFIMSLLPMAMTAVNNVRSEDSGIASALFNSSQQIGVALGLAILSTVAVTTTQARMPNALVALQQARSVSDEAMFKSAATALVDGYSMAFLALAIILVGAAVMSTMLINVKAEDLKESDVPIV